MAKPTRYEQDIVTWAQEQAALLRAGRLSELDIEHIAEEIEDVGKSEQRELISRMAVLITDLLKWQCQPERRGNSWRLTIREQRRAIERRLKRTPSLRVTLADLEWLADAWADGADAAAREMLIGRHLLPESCPWTVNDMLDPDWLPTD